MMAALTMRMCGYVMTPSGDVRRGRWCSGCRGGVQSAVTSAMAVRVEDSSTMALSAAKAATRARSARVVDRARITPAGLMNERDRVVGEQRVVTPGQREVVTQVAAGLLVGHGRHRVAQSDALVERGEHAEFHPPPLGNEALRAQNHADLAVVTGPGIAAARREQLRPQQQRCETEIADLKAENKRLERALAAAHGDCTDAARSAHRPQ
jgi:hypothetical protein